MTPGVYTESTLVQQTTADYLEQQLGWQSVYAHNAEDLGPNSLLGRSSDREVVLTRILRQKLVELNPGLPGAAYDDALRQITATVASQTLASTNREKYGLMRDGVQVAFRNENGELVKERMRLFDFDQPASNHFLAVRELWVQGDLYRRRADIIGFVNGLPLLFIECKNIHKNLKAAFENNFSDYIDTIPRIFHHNAIVMFGNGEQAKIGTITSKWEHFHEWKRLIENEPGAVDMGTLLKGICEKRNFLDLLEMFTRKIHRKLGGNFTFLVLTDRDDLDTQIYKTFAGCGVVDNDRDPCRATSGTHLSRLLTEHKAYIFSLIQKFNMKVDPLRGIHPERRHHSDHR